MSVEQVGLGQVPITPWVAGVDGCQLEFGSGTDNFTLVAKFDGCSAEGNASLDPGAQVWCDE
ncbi:hypothetical protein NHF46_06055 [Arthrobacter alpinus]|nr:hypothetical protein [Arthrobacter alpinus]